jgi:hypothetical protein
MKCPRCRRERPNGCRHYKPRSTPAIHGTRTTYVHLRCRCDACRLANKAYEQARLVRAEARAA